MSKIEWLQHPAYKPETWNAITGCSKIAVGCKHCFAETIAKRFFATLYQPNQDGSLRRFTDVRTHPDRLKKPLHWRKPRLVFVNSMSDLFHPSVPFEFITKIYNVMLECPQHRFVILTKRIVRAQEYYKWAGLDAEITRADAEWPPANVALGVSVSTQEDADAAIPTLLALPAALHVVSYEPALDAVSLDAWLGVDLFICDSCGDEFGAGERGHDNRCDCGGVGAPNGHSEPEIDLVYLGGESGSKARPCNVEWLRAVVRECQQSGTLVFVKQIGSHSLPTYCLSDPKGANPLEWPVDLRIREYPEEWLV